jgi:molybdate/tungstate transport system permease protein
VSRRFHPTSILFALLGAPLFLNLVVPIANLFLQSDWPMSLRAMRQPQAIDALRVSVLTSTIALLIISLTGVPLGYLLARAKLPFKRFWIGLTFLPLVLPDLAGGILLLQLYGPYGTIGRPFDAGNIPLTGNLCGIVLVQIFVAAPFVIVSALAAFLSVDPELESAARTLGDSSWQVFCRISLPLAWPGIAAGITLAWIRGLGEFGATLIMAYNPHTLPVFLWVKFETDGLAGALPIVLCLLLLAATAVAVSMNLGRLKRLSDVLTPLG